ncbi:MAG: hypothetical protein ACI9G1_001764 [Pirellulaceae bacterium]
MNIRHTIQKLACLALGLVVTAAPLAQLQAQEKPVAVISITNTQKLMDDAEYLMEAAGMGDAAQGIMLMVGGATRALDRTRPAGAIIMLEGLEPRPIAFLPVDNLDQLFKALKFQIGEPEDVGDGIFEIAGDQDQPAFVKQSGKWAYIAMEKEQLTGALPADPSQYLGKLPENYAIAIQINVQNIPQEIRDMGIDQVKMIQEQAQQAAGTEEEREMQKQLAENSVKQMTMMLNECETMTMGWAIDKTSKTTSLEMEMKAVAGSELAAKLTAFGDQPSDFAGFLVPNAAVTMHLSTKSQPEDIKNAIMLIQTMQQQVLSEIDNDQNVENEEMRKSIKEVLNALFDVVQQTVESGKTNGGAALVLKPQEVTFVGGAFIADGIALEGIFKKLAELGKNEPGFPDVKFNAENHAGVNFHTMRVPVPDEEARDVLGDNLDIVVGTGAKSVYFAFGAGADSTLKQVIDTSAAQAGQKGSPLEIKVALQPIIEFMAANEQNPINDALLVAIKEANGKDKVLLEAKAIENGVHYSFKIEEGVLKLIGAGAASSLGGGGAGDAPAFDEF